MADINVASGYLTLVGETNDPHWLVCSQCGVRVGNGPFGCWRFNGEHWEHKCPGIDPQCGHFAAITSDEYNQRMAASAAN